MQDSCSGSGVGRRRRRPADRARGAGGVLARLGCVVSIGMLGGCDIPTEPPEVDNRWIVPAEETRFGVVQLLPGDVTVTADSSAFIVDFDPVSFSETLGTLCPLCAAADSQTVPKPPFLGSFASGIGFPPEVHSVTIVAGVIDLELQNGLNFDPLRPASGATGTVTLTITDDADDEVFATLVLDGSDTAFDPGSVLTRSVDLQPGTITGSLTSTADVDSPLGDPVTIDASLPISVTATPMNILVSAVEIDVANRSVTLDPVSLDVEDVDAEVRDRVIAGAFVVDVTNPFALGADFRLSISGPTIATIQKTATVEATAASTVRIEFTTAEMRSFLGEPDVLLTGGAVIDPGAGPIVVSPGEELIFDAKLDLTIRLGG